MSGNLTPKQESLTIPLSQGHIVLVDPEDYEQLCQFTWFAAVRDHAVYAVRHRSRTERRGVILMHRELLSAKRGQLVDHRNHNGLDNRRANLRLCTTSENTANSRPQTGRSSCYKGVTWFKGYQKWRAYICPNGRFVHLGYFDSEEAAARAYNVAAKLHFGEFCLMNEVA